MTAIPNFPHDLMHLHHEWHLGVTRGAKPGTPGSGLEFLLFHRRFVAKVAERFRAEGRSVDLSGWRTLPGEVKSATDVDPNGVRTVWADNPAWEAALRRVATQPGTFGSADELGTFFEGPGSGYLHGWLHKFAGAAYGDKNIADLATAPGTVEFYRLHGLIDLWFSNWVKAVAPGHLWHTVRGPWPPMYYGDVTAVNGLYMPEVTRVAVAADGPDLHVVIVRTDGEVWHAIRHATGWQKFHNVGDVIGRQGRVEDVACAVVNGELHVCAVNEHGRLLHAIRYADHWQSWGDAGSAAQAKGNFAKVSCAAVAGTLHVVALAATDRRPWHTIRYPTKWQPFGNVAGAAGDRGWLDEVDCAGDGDLLHVVAANADGKLWHTTRNPASWTPLADVCTTSAGPLKPVRRVACTHTNGELHVCAVDDRRTVWHTIRWPNGWQPWGGVTAVTESEDIPAYADLACGAVNGEMHLCVVGAEYRP